MAVQTLSGVNCWFSIRIDILAMVLIVTFSLTCVFARDFTDPIVLSMLLSYILTIQMYLTYALKVFMNLQSTMVNANRCVQMLSIPQEAEDGQSLLTERPQWPEQGLVQFQDVHLKYRPTTETVLHGLTFRVEPGEKIGVVGRTGAGKSTICLSIARIVEIFQGQIFIDGVDIAKIPLK